MDYLVHIGVIIGIYMVLAASLNIVVGYAGILSLAQAAFFGIGAYVAALLALRTNCPFLLNAALAAATCGILGAILGGFSLAVRDDYFVVATFAFQIICLAIFNNWISLTGGPMGLPGIPQPALFGWTVSFHWEFLLLSAALATLSLWLCQRLVLSPVGRALEGVREDEELTAALGKDVYRLKVMAFAVASALSGVAGVLYAHYISFIDPTSFTVMESVFIISIVIIGGAGSLWGPVVGAVVLVTLPELLRFVGMPSSVAANVRQILYGTALVACMMWRPQGLMGEFSFRKNENS